jgi:penicillin amidase
MLQKILYIFTILITIGLTLFLNGNFNPFQNPLPPLGAFLNPFGGAWTSDNRNETIPVTLTGNGLTGKVEIIYDDRRVAHIFASNLDDALFAQGYAEAQNRLFQMEFLTKVAAGELSSIFGSRTLEVDLEKRHRGMKYAAENAVKGWEKTNDYNRVMRYVDGVNAYIKSLKPENYPIEYKIFNLKPTEWTPLKSALVFKQMSLTLAGRNDDVSSTNLYAALGKNDFDLLYPEKQAVENPVIPLEKAYTFDKIYGPNQDSTAYVNKPVLKSYFEAKEKGIGSNSWAVSGTKSSTGKPIFCNDPHLSLGLPSIWFEEHIITPEFNAYGVSFPGMPGIMIGFNEDIAWGETNVGQDVEDLFQIEWADAAKTKYILDGKPTDVTYRIEEIKIKGSKTIFDTIKYTYWGPIYKNSVDGSHDLAMRWLCHDVPDTDEYNVFISAMKCKNYDQYLAASEGYISPAQNFGFASTSGDIALRVNGRFPARHYPDGRFVEYGNKSKNNWQEWIPKHQNPQIINPKRGFISSSNQVSADKSYPYYFTGKFERYRNRSVNDKLTAMNNISPEDMKKLQQDAFSHKAADLIGLLKEKNIDFSMTDGEKAMYNMLIEWDFHYKADSEAPTLFELFYKKLSENMWDEISELGENMNVHYPESWRLFELIKNDPTNKFFDIKSSKRVEDANAILSKSMKDAIAELVKRKTEGKGNTWGEYKPLHFYHLTRLPVFSSLDNRANGCPDAINATGNSFGPSWRMVVSLEKSVKAYGVYPGGQSGNPSSKYYKNMINSWLKGEYYTLHFVKNADEIKKFSTQTVTLNPTK